MFAQTFLPMPGGRYRRHLWCCEWVPFPTRDRDTECSGCGSTFELAPVP